MRPTRPGSPEEVSMPRAPLASRSLAVAALILAAATAARASELVRCLEDQPLPRVARVRTSMGEIRWARVVESAGGMPSRVALLPNGVGLATALANASQPPARTSSCSPSLLRIPARRSARRSR
jgi:hypothetical protein